MNASETRLTFFVEEGGERLDKFLSRMVSSQSRAILQRAIVEGFASVNEITERKPARKLAVGDTVRIALPPPSSTDIEPEAIPLSILYENNDLLVINKPAGMVVHPAAGHWKGTLAGAVLAHAPEVRGVGEVERPGIIHRLDKDTSGLILVAKNAATQRDLQAAFASRKVEKTYLALVVGAPPTPEGRIEAAIGRDPSQRQRMAVVPESRGRSAVTLYKTSEQFNGYSLLEAHPLTGRTHQIRVHLAFIGCPVVGDAVYGKRGVKKGGLAGRQLLHAWKLRIRLPGESENRLFEAPLPVDFEASLTILRKDRSEG